MSTSFHHVMRRHTTTIAFAARKSRLQYLWPSYSTRRFGSSDTVETDECAIPLQPTWSVNDLLSSYPKPSISPSQLKHLHELSALLPPEESTSEHAELTEEMEDLAKLVEAVRVANLQDLVHGESEEGVPDGRIWVEGMGIQFSDKASDGVEEVHGRDLLAWAPRTSDGMYVVDTDRKRK